MITSAVWHRSLDLVAPLVLQYRSLRFSTVPYKPSVSRLSISDIHNLLITKIDDAEALLADPRTNSVRYAEDIGFWSDNLAPLIAILTGRDFDDLAQTVEINFAGSDEDGVNLLSAEITRTISEITDDRLDEIANSWASLDEEITWR